MYAQFSKEYYYGSVASLSEIVTITGQWNQPQGLSLACAILLPVFHLWMSSNHSECEFMNVAHSNSRRRIRNAIGHDGSWHYLSSCEKNAKIIHSTGLCSIWTQDSLCDTVRCSTNGADNTSRNWSFGWFCKKTRYIPQDACRELLCVFGNFHVSRTQG